MAQLTSAYVRCVVGYGSSNVLNISAIAIQHCFETVATPSIFRDGGDDDTVSYIIGAWYYPSSSIILKWTLPALLRHVFLFISVFYFSMFVGPPPPGSLYPIPRGNWCTGVTKVKFSLIKFLAHQLNQDDPRTSMAPTKITGRLNKTTIPLEYR